MRKADRWLQRWRFRMARPWILPDSHLLDIGCHQGEFFDFLGKSISRGIGLDPLAITRQTPRYHVLPLCFKTPLAYPDESFDVITLLATLEHMPQKETLPHECWRLLRPEGRVILTVPSPHVDLIVAGLQWLRLADGMSLEQHHQFQPAETLPLFFRHSFRLLCRRRFQLGLNQLFVFYKQTNSR